MSNGFNVRESEKQSEGDNGGRSPVGVLAFKTGRSDNTWQTTAGGEEATQRSQEEHSSRGSNRWVHRPQELHAQHARGARRAVWQEECT